MRLLKYTQRVAEHCVGHLLVAIIYFVLILSPFFPPSTVLNVYKLHSAAVVCVWVCVCVLLFFLLLPLFFIGLLFLIFYRFFVFFSCFFSATLIHVWIKREFFPAVA